MEAEVERLWQGLSADPKEIVGHVTSVKEAVTAVCRTQESLSLLKLDMTPIGMARPLFLAPLTPESSAGTTGCDCSSLDLNGRGKRKSYGVITCVSLYPSLIPNYYSLADVSA